MSCDTKIGEKGKLSAYLFHTIHTLMSGVDIALLTSGDLYSMPVRVTIFFHYICINISLTFCISISMSGLFSKLEKKRLEFTVLYPAEIFVVLSFEILVHQCWKRYFTTYEF